MATNRALHSVSRGGARIAGPWQGAGVPEGDSLHRLARMLHPKLVNRPLSSLTLVRSGARTEGLVGSRIRGVEARGKNLLVHFEAPWSLHVHLKMNGQVRLSARTSGAKIAMSQASAILETPDQRVVVYGAPIARLLRTRDLTRDFHLRGLGPDLLGPSFDLDEALARVRTHGTRALGEVLLDQSAVAGIGNVWKSELCFNLRLDPFAPVARYRDEELSSLLALARTQMVDNVYGPRRSAPDPFEPPAHRKTRLDRRQGQAPVSVYERAGQPCYDCGTTIELRRQGEQLRSTYFCPGCQPSRGGD